MTMRRVRPPLSALPASACSPRPCCCRTGAAFAQDTPAAAGAGAAATPQRRGRGHDIVVTATRRAENLQDVPIAITAHRHRDARRAAGRRVRRLCPARPEPLLSSSPGPGSANVYFRGVAAARTPTTRPRCRASAPISTSSRSRPSPARSTSTSSTSPGSRRSPGRRARSTAPRARPAPSASSPTSPTRAALYGEVDLELNSVAHGDIGYTGEGFINAPLSSNVALRVVGWYRHDAGYIDNIPGTPAPSRPPGITFNNDALVEDDYNDVETYGAAPR